MTLSYPHPVYCLAFSRDSALIAAAGEHVVYIWSLRDGERKHELAVGMWPITGLAFSGDARVLYVGGYPEWALVKLLPNPGLFEHGIIRPGRSLAKSGSPIGLTAST